MAVVLALAVLLVGTYVVRPFFVPSISMIPTLRVRETVLVDVAAYRWQRPRAGDIAVFMPPIASQGTPFVKRVVGIPGDTIRIQDGVLYRDGSVVPEPYVNEAPRYDLQIARDSILVNGVPLDPRSADIPPRSMWQAPNRVPAGFYLVLGDNRNYSDDSHQWGFAQFSGVFAAGPLARRRDRARFIGRAVMVLWPFSHIRLLN